MICESKKNKWSAVVVGFILCLIGVVSGAAYGSTNSGLLIFATGSPPSSLNAVYVYKCSDSTCKTQTQLDNSGYIYYTPTWTPPSPAPQLVGTAPWAFLYTPGTYALWQTDSSNHWRSCTVSINASGFDQANSTCPGLVWANQSQTDDTTAQISLGAPDANGFIITSGMLIPAPAPQSPPNPRGNVLTPKRTITFVNKSSYASICINPHGVLSSTPCDKKDVGSFQVAKGMSHVLKIPSAGADSKAAVVSGIKFSSKDKTFTPTGQNFSVAKDPSYATRLEWTMWPQQKTNTTGVTTINTSVVNGYNVGFNFYPDSNVICARAHKEGGPSHFNLYAKSNSMSKFPYDDSNPKDLCPQGQLAQGNLGCYSDCSYATKTSAANAPQLCCSGTYANPPADPQTSNSCPTPSQISRPYSTALNTTVLKDSYTWAYEDYRGTFTCDGNTSFTMEITDFDVPHADVNAGPIYNNEQAQQVCPTVCKNAGGKWNGQWTTTQPGQMSVCGCLLNSK